MGLKIMVYTYGDYKLYTLDINWKYGKKQTIYFFSKKIPEKGEECNMPDGYEMEVHKKTGMPYLRYSKGITSHWKNWSKQ